MRETVSGASGEHAGEPGREGELETGNRAVTEDA
jgi:hypothetical protein